MDASAIDDVFERIGIEQYQIPDPAKLYGTGIDIEITRGRCRAGPQGLERR